MNAQTRIRLALAGIVVLIGSTALLAGLSGDEQNGAVHSVPTTGGATGATPASASGANGTGGTAPRRVADHGPLLRAGALRRITVKKGQIVRFRARSTGGDELHVHGYDLHVELPAGKTVDYSFRARLDGVFVVELHSSDERVAELRVNP